MRVKCADFFVRYLIVALTVLPCVLPAATNDRWMSFDDLGRGISIGDIQMSPDGLQVAATISRPDYVDNRYASSLVLIDVKTGLYRELAPSRLDVSTPRWSPTGDRLAWLDSSQGGATQIYVITMARGEFSRPLAVTQVSTGIRSYEWSPDGRSFAFTSGDPPAASLTNKSDVNSFEVLDNDYLATAPMPSSYIGVVSLDDGVVRRLTSAPETVRRMAWLPGGQTIAFLSKPRPGSTALADLSLRTVDASGAQPRTLLQGPVEKTPLQLLFPASPDGRWIAYSRARGPEPEYRSEEIVLISASGGESRQITASVDRNFVGMTWLPDGKSIIAAADDETRVGLWVHPLNGSSRRIDLGNIIPQAFGSLSASRTGAFAFIGSQPHQPSEIYIMNSVDAKPRRLTHFNSHFETLKLGRVEKISWQLDGFDQSGVLMYPPDYQSGQRRPLVLVLHGGPMDSSKEAFNEFSQLLAAQGWLVFEPNYRGSTSNGDAFQRAVINDGGDGPGRDVMAGIAVLKKRGIVDETRMAVSGWSYGGYMTVWLTAHYPVWRAAVAGAAVTDLIDNYSLSDLNVWTAYGLGGSPWVNGNAEHYRKQSPITYAHQIRTPTLILHNTGDSRVPITDAYKLYYALRDNSVPVRFIAFPAAGHGKDAGGPAHKKELYRHWIDWFASRFGSALNQNGAAR